MVTDKRGQTLRKTERLHEKRAIEELVNIGRSVSIYPFRLLWVVNEGESKPAVKVVFAVPRRNFKKAVDRNLLKRRMREAYRKNKYILVGVAEAHAKHYNLMFVYTAKDKMLYKEIEAKIVVALQRLADKNNGK